MSRSSSTLKQIFEVRRDELPLALLMFTYFFLVITTFWILKPLKKSAFITFYDETGVDVFGWAISGSQAELLAKVLNMVVAFVAVAVFTWLVRYLRRQQLTYVFSAFIATCLVVYSFTLDRPGDTTIWTFYLFGDLYSTLMVATFFAFLNDSVDPDTAKRLYGPIGLGGVAGGAFGSTVVRARIGHLSYHQWLWICLAVAAVIVVVAALAGRIVARRTSGSESDEPAEEVADTRRGSMALEGARMVLRSPYLLSIVAIVGLYEMVSTIMDFQFTATIEHYLSGPAIGVQFSTVYSITNLVALGVQLFGTSFVMRRFGVGVALLFLPVAALAGSVGFMIFPVLWVGSLLNTADNGFSYSINQSAKEVLYVPTSRAEKYKAKAFIDMFGQRFAKVLAVVGSLVTTTIISGFASIRWLSLVTAAILVVWIIAVRYAGRTFAAKEAPATGQSS